MVFDWDHHNEKKVRAHEIEPGEAEQSFFDPDRVPLDAHTARKKLVGMTEDGRILTVIYEKKNKMIRVVTGWDSSEWERKSYYKRRRK
ncbi:BrnT family toxin [Rossellomorea vietnamensis]|uniref:BrnT family toxin n=1 Tax=Rossellomorea vietnamensis TaxID=218284 RepID=UPI00077C36D7|nr:BrnT family toxin [Rossellomorea vietnamensis]